MNDIAIIIPNYNMPEAVRNIIRVIEGSPEGDLIIVDNGSDLFRFKESQATMLHPLEFGGARKPLEDWMEA